MSLESRAASHRNNRIRKTPLVFQHTAMKEAGFKNRESAPIVQALKSLGADRITPQVIAEVRDWLAPGLRRKVLADTVTVTSSVYAAIRRIARDDPGECRGLSASTQMSALLRTSC